MIKRNIPKVRFKQFCDFWKTYKLGNLGSVAMNKRIFKEETSEAGEIPFYKIGTFGSEPDSFITREKFEEYKSKYPYPEIGDILISASGSIGRTVEYQGEEAYFQDSNIVWLKHDERLDNSFLKQFYSIVKWQGIEGTTIKRLYNKNILETSIALPSISEQTAIGSLFRTLDDLLASYKDNLANYQSLKATMLSKMFPKAGQTVPEIRLDGFEGEWEEKKLSEIVDIVGGGTPDTNVKEYWDGEINWFSPTEVGNSIYLDTSEKRISELGLQKSSAKILPANRTILFTSRAGIGSVGIITKDSTTNQGFQSLVTKKGIDIYFLFSYSSEITRYALKHSAGSTFLEISGKELGKMDIIIPSYDEQQAIGSYFSNLDNLIAAHQEKISQLETLKKKLLQDMFI